MSQTGKSHNLCNSKSKQSGSNVYQSLKANCYYH